MTIAYIGIGSNLGNREFHIQTAINQIDQSYHTTVLRISPIYETAPVDMPNDSPSFLNGALELETTLPPEKLLDLLKKIEQSMGRIRRTSEINQSRPIDLDILLFGDEVIIQDQLHIPHPRMHERWFAIKPLSHLCPDKKIPNQNLTILEILHKIESTVK